MLTSISEKVRSNFYCSLILAAIATSCLMSSGITRLCVLGISDTFGWFLLTIPCLSILTIFVSFGCFCSYMFIQMMREYHLKFVKE